MKFLDLFAGIGGFRMGMELAGHECVGYVEIDKFARKSYEAIYDTEGEWTAHDITSVTNDDLRLLATRGIDVICGGFPCQAFSVAGKRLGFEDTRGTLFFEIARFAKEIKPRYLFLENVKGLLSHDKGRTFETILCTLDELGYDAEWQVLNSKDFGVPQNRERVFIIGHLRGQRTRKVFPITRSNKKTLNQIIGGQQGMRVYDPEGVSCTLSSEGGGWGAKTGLYAIPVLTPERKEKQQNGRRFKKPDEPMFTLTAQDRHGVAVLRYVRTEYGKQIRKQYEAGEIKEKIANIRKLEPRTDGLSNTVTTVEKDNYLLENYRIRKLTPRECWRLQGFPDWAFEKAAKVNSDSQLYKQAGNSVTVNVIYEIAKRLKEE
jgi:DNA (cytosine-5)-methyltransferase 1